MAKFNPNEVVFEKIRYIEEFDPTTRQLLSRLTNVKEPTLNFSSEGTPVTDAQGAEIVTFYNAAQGTLSYTNVIHSFDLLAEQFSYKNATKMIWSVLIGVMRKYLVILRILQSYLPKSKLMTTDGR